MSAEQFHLSAFGFAMRYWVLTHAPHFHICNGERPGGCFLQSEAWEVNEMVRSHVARVIAEEVRSELPMKLVEPGRRR